DAEFVVARDVLVRPADRAAGGHVVGVVLDRELALDLELAAVLHAHGGRAEADLRVALAVEEVRGLQVTREVLVLDYDRIDVDVALESRRAILADVEGAVVVLEAAA